MNITIDNICGELNTYAQVLKQNATTQINEILPKKDVLIREPQTRTQTVVSNPERAWIVAGELVLGVGLLGAIFSGSGWYYALGTAGLASIIYGQSKKITKNNGLLPLQPTSEPKGYEVAEKVIEISNMVENKWRQKVEDAKKTVQDAIETSNISPDVKDALLENTYTTERISINFDEVISRLDSQPSSTYPSLLSEYEKFVISCIDKASGDQIAIYRSISQQL